MITVGLSRDVVALDTRVVGALHRYFGYNLAAGRVQSSKQIYLSVEQALRTPRRKCDGIAEGCSGSPRAALGVPSPSPCTTSSPPATACPAAGDSPPA